MNPTTTTTHPATQALTATSGTFTSDVSLSDNVKLNIGAGPAFNRTGGDLQIYHDGSKTIIDEDGTGALEIKTNRLYIRQANDELLADFRKDQYVRLYYDNTKRFETTDNGVEITGDIVLSGSGNGINLGVTSNTDSNTLDDYEEGSWTPSMSGYTTAGSFSSSSVDGVYTKVGKFVHCEFRISGGNLSSAAGYALLKGLPFTIGGTGYGCSGSFAFHTVDFDPSSIPVLQLGGGTQAYFLVSNDDSGWGTLPVSAFDNNPFTFIGTFTYVASA